jgi:chromosome segregation ATPase
MNIGDYLLKSNKLTQKQREKAELEHEVSGNKFGKCCIDLGFITRTELNQALKAIQRKDEGVRKPMATEIGEGSKFTFDLKFIATMATILVSACTTYFSITGQIEELKSANSPSRLEFTHLKDKVDSIESNGDLKLITYQLNEFKETFSEIKVLATTLSPLATDLEYIKGELNKLKNKKIDIPEVDLSTLEEAIRKIGMDVNAMQGSLQEFEDRVGKLESKSGGRF